MGDTISSLLFQPPPPTKLKAEKVIWLESRRGIKVPAFYISYSNIDGADVSRSLTLEQVKKSRPSEGITVLYSHANAEDLGSIYPWCKYLSRMLHVNLMAYDYAGYGMAYDQGESETFYFFRYCGIF
jgi:abhydrolase domain-containing protein 17